jgi:hypothetical protein
MRERLAPSEDYEPTVLEEAGEILEVEWQWAIVDLRRMFEAVNKKE